MTDVAGDPNWLLSSVVQATAVILGLYGLFVVGRQMSVTGHRRAVELRRSEVETMIRLRTLQLKHPEPGPAGSGTESGITGTGRDSAAEELAVLQSEAQRLESALEKLHGAPGWLSLLVLGYLAVMGLLLPMVLMPARSAAFDPSAVWSLGGIQLTGLAWKRLVVAGFASGLLFALLQVAWATIRDTARTLPKP